MISSAYCAPPTACRGREDHPVPHDLAPGGPAAARRADPVLGGDPHPVEGHAVLSVGTDGELLGEVDPLGARIDEEEVDRVRRVAGAREDDQPARGLGERDVALHARQEESVSVGDRPHLHAAGTEPVVGLEPRRREHRLAADDCREPLPPERLAARAGECASGKDRAHEVRRGREGAAELLVEHDSLECPHPRASVLLGQEQTDEVEGGELLPELG